MFLPGLAEIKMLYEQLQSNRMFNNRGANRSVSKGVPLFLRFFVYSQKEKTHLDSCSVIFFLYSFLEPV